MDYETIGTSITIAAGQTSGTIPVEVIDDLLVEGSEEVTLTLTGITSGDPQISVDTNNDEASVTIDDNDSALVSIAATDASSDESGSDNGQFTVSLDHQSSSDTEVSYSISGLAENGVDYVTLTGSVIIPANSSSAVIDVTVLSDDLVEGSEDVTLTLTGITSGDPQISVDTNNDEASVTIEDDDVPSITCPIDISEGTDIGQCYGTVDIPNQVYNTNWPTAILSWEMTGATIDNGIGQIGSYEFNSGITQILYFVYDNISANTASCTFNVTITDDEDPTITCPVDVVQTADADECEADVSIASPGTSDNCGVSSVVNNYNGTSDASDTYPVGTTLVTWTVTDIHGNTSSCVQSVTITDDEDPTITACAANVTVGTDDGLCSATNVALGTVTATDNCTAVADLTITNNAPASFPIGTTTVTWTVEDATGNTTTCEQLVVVEDDEDPVISACAADVNVGTDDGTCTATNVALGTVTATDNCDTDLTIINNAPAEFPIGTTTVTWTVEDATGNTTTCEQLVTVEDDEDPTIIACAANVSVGTDDSQCSATNVALGNVTVTDNCTAVADLTITNNAPTIFPIGVTTVTWTVEDATGNTTTCEQLVTVEDDEDPTITACAVDVMVGTDDGQCSATNVALGNVTATDNCTAVADLTITNNAPAIFPIGATTVTWTVEDASGNTTTCEQLVTVEDDEDPTIIACAANVTVGTDDGQCSATNVALGNVTATDNCTAVADLTITNNAPASFPIGTTTVTWTVEDATGNTTTCEQLVVVEDDEDPVISACAADVNVGTDDGTCTATNVALGTVTATDNCDTDLTIINNAPAEFPIGTTTVIWTVTDNSGNATTCEQLVVVEDDEDPVISACAADVNVGTDDGTCTATNVALGTVTATDNCDTDLTITNNAPAEFPIGTTTVIWTVTDNAGNATTCEQ
ncbi:MAG: HYR domain-containing protein, partial [Candidatus Methanomethylophilaceae archaeon]|nr:HYR domain-containing protein [Candidatus Methanomethylophilaceae archaeon]